MAADGSVERLSLSSEEVPMRVLVAAASKYGSTVGIAEAIGRRAEDAGFEVEVMPIEEVGDVAEFDALVLGSGVYAGRWLKPARQLVDDHLDEIASRPTWLFSSGPIGDPAKPDADSAVKLDEIVAKTKAREHRVFAGKLDKGVLRFGDRAIVSAVRSAEGDFRDWDEIAAWADEIVSALTPSTEVVAQRTEER
jgi:menaquinone-dependent protoporphyrinogen oxidase